MYLYTVSHKQALILLPFLLSLPINTVSFDDYKRAPGPCSDDNIEKQASTLDGPSSQSVAGIGVEFETAAIRFESVSGDCDEATTSSSKGQVVSSRTGTNWRLTADTLGEANDLTAEYILDGTRIKIGNGDAARAAADIVVDFVSLL